MTVKGGGGAIVFHRDDASGLAPYLQLIQQVKHGLRLRHLRVGDRLPTVRDVAAQLAINPNTVLKAYRQLEVERLLESRPGLGVFVAANLAGPSPEDQAELRGDLLDWLARARAAGLDAESIDALIADTIGRYASLGVA
jgi:GntR family transcriptional regulator